MIKEEIESIEHNYKLYNENIRKDLDILLTSTIPIQKQLMKTILWINATILGLTIAAIEKKLAIYWISVPFFFSFIAIIKVLLSLKDGRIKYFGAPSIEYIENIPNNQWTKSKGIVNTNKSLKFAFDKNSDIVKNRAEKISFSINCTIFSIISIFLIGIIYVNFKIL